eukprot:366238-Chlamydomonas_euryale.AAC.12
MQDVAGGQVAAQTSCASAATIATHLISFGPRAMCAVCRSWCAVAVLMIMAVGFACMQHACGNRVPNLKPWAQIKRGSPQGRTSMLQANVSGMGCPCRLLHVALALSLLLVLHAEQRRVANQLPWVVVVVHRAPEAGLALAIVEKLVRVRRSRAGAERVATAASASRVLLVAEHDAVIGRAAGGRVSDGLRRSVAWREHALGDALAALKEGALLLARGGVAAAAGALWRRAGDAPRAMRLLVHAATSLALGLRSTADVHDSPV